MPGSLKEQFWTLSASLKASGSLKVLGSLKVPYSAPPGVTAALDQNRSSLISVLPGATVQDQMQASLTEVKN